MSPLAAAGWVAMITGVLVLVAGMSANLVINTLDRRRMRMHKRTMYRSITVTTAVMVTAIAGTLAGQTIGIKVGYERGWDDGQMWEESRSIIGPPGPAKHLLVPTDPGFDEHLRDGCRSDPSWSPCAMELGTMR